MKKQELNQAFTHVLEEKQTLLFSHRDVSILLESIPIIMAVVSFPQQSPWEHTVQLVNVMINYSAFTPLTLKNLVLLKSVLIILYLIRRIVGRIILKASSNTCKKQGTRLTLVWMSMFLEIFQMVLGYLHLHLLNC